MFRRIPRCRIHLVIKGRVGQGWVDVDQVLKVVQGMTLRHFIEFADSRGIPIGGALRDSPHLAESLMWNGERCPVAEHGERVLVDGDEIYLLAPLAGG